MDDNPNLHMVVFPWLAIGHLIPFLELTKSLASNGHHVSLLSTPRNLQRLPKIPQNLSSLINLVNLPFPSIQNLPETAQSSSDISVKNTQLLKRAFDGLQPHVTQFLENSSLGIDWIIYDYASHWLVEVAAKLHIPCIFFSLFNAATLSFFGPPSSLMAETRVTPQAYTLVPKWIPFHSNIVYRLHEILPNFEGFPQPDMPDDMPDSYRFGVAMRDCEFIAIRSCMEFEPEWLTFLTELLQKPVIPVGSLHPSVHVSKEDHQEDEEWMVIRKWLDKRKEESVIYVAMGTESVLSQTQIGELALGLERSGLPFFWVLRAPPESSIDVLTMLPTGFMDRVEDQGVVATSWVPQVKILAHRSIGGFLTHCGWNSVIEGLGYGKVLVLLPMLNDQGLTARLLEGKKVGFEIPRNQQDGSFTSESVSESLRIVMVDKEGEELRKTARAMREVFGDVNMMGRYMDSFVGYLKAHKRLTLKVAKSLTH